jgi:hypothetical protein
MSRFGVEIRSLQVEDPLLRRRHIESLRSSSPGFLGAVRLSDAAQTDQTEVP